MITDEELRMLMWYIGHLESENRMLKANVISSSAVVDEVPTFRQGPPEHELEEFMTAEQANYLANEVYRLRQTVNSLAGWD